MRAALALDALLFVPQETTENQKDRVDPMVAMLSGEQILLANPLGTLTNSWIIARPVRGRSRVLVAINRLTDIRRIKTTHPALLVISSALFLIAAAAYCSKDGGGAAIPIGILGVLFLAAYWGTRRGSVMFVSGWEITETVTGTLREAAELVKAVRKAQREVDLDA